MFATAYPLDTYIVSNVTNFAGWQLCPRELASELRRRAESMGDEARALVMNYQTATALEGIVAVPGNVLPIYTDRLRFFDGKGHIEYAIRVLAELPTGTIYVVPADEAESIAAFRTIAERVPEERMIRLYNYGLDYPDICAEIVYDDDDE